MNVLIWRADTLFFPIQDVVEQYTNGATESF